MASRPTTPRSTTLPVGEGSDVGTTDTVKPDEAAPVQEKTPQNGTEPTTSSPKLALLFVSVMTSMFLVGLDRSIISTAVPKITDDFNSLPDVGWYGGAYLLTCCAFQLLYGKIYTFYSIKTTLILSILLFEIGSAICGAAPNSIAFIIGRSISGVGAAGVFAGTVVCIVHTVPLDRRSQTQGLFGALFGLASIVGPLIGGAFTSNVTWRWCFYINLPIGAVAMVVVFFCLDVPDRDTTKLPRLEKLAQLDAPGTSVLIPGVVCLLLALQWGGQMYAWNNWRVIVLLVLAGLLLIAFCAAQVLLPKTATIHPRIFKQRSIIAGCWATICIGASQYTYIYYLPVWFQAIKGVSAVDSGIRLIPLMISSVVAMILGGIINRKVGYYTALAIVGSCIMVVGAGLLYTLDVHAGKGKWIGYQIVYGVGSGLCFQTPNLAAQTVLPKRDAPVGLALMFFASMLGSAVFVAVGQNVLDNELVKRLAGLPGFHPSLVTGNGATGLLESLPEHLRETGLKEYNGALQQVFLVGLILSCLVVPGAAAMEWRSILHKPQEEPSAEADKEAAAKKTDTVEEDSEKKSEAI